MRNDFIVGKLQKLVSMLIIITLAWQGGAFAHPDELYLLRPTALAEREIYSIRLFSDIRSVRGILSAAALLVSLYLAWVLPEYFGLRYSALIRWLTTFILIIWARCTRVVYETWCDIEYLWNRLWERPLHPTILGEAARERKEPSEEIGEAKKTGGVDMSASPLPRPGPFSEQGAGAFALEAI